MLEHAVYPFPPVGSRAALARMLQCTLVELDYVEFNTHRLYREVKQIKKDGTYRICYDAKPRLKRMQGRIQRLILKRVSFPSYLMGGLADREKPRDYVRNANVHAGARVVVNEDIAGFFPATSDRVVFDIWRHLFHFPHEVATTLARLTTHMGCLPQGAKTSSYLANLVFWAQEPRVVEKLQSMGFAYTRYIDDMTISSKTDKTADEMGTAIGLLASMVRRYGLALKRKKHSIAYAGQRKEVTGLVVGMNAAGLHQAKRSNIRALVHQCEVEVNDAAAHSGAQRRAASLVGQYVRLHPRKGKALKQRLQAIRSKTLK